MERKSLKVELSEILHSLYHGMSENDAENQLIDLIYDRHQENTMKLFLGIQERERKKLILEVENVTRGTESAISSLAFMSKQLIEKNDSKKAKIQANLIYSDELMSVLLDTCKAYFPDGEVHAASNSTRWHFDKFVEVLLANKEKYMPKGESRQWANEFGHSKYIDMIIEKYDNVEEVETIN